MSTQQKSSKTGLKPKQGGESTAPTADGNSADALREDVQRYKHAFETTAEDRERWRKRHEESEQAALFLFEQFARQAGVNNQTPPSPGPPVSALIPDIEKTTETTKRGSPSLEQFVTPNVYCVGAMKSGTSYLYSVLRLHSKIQVAEKDSGQLSQFYYEQNAANLRKYLSHAKSDSTASALLCDFDVGFWKRENSAQLISTHLNPNARIILCLRNPVDRLLSHYLMRVRQYQPGRIFTEALGLFDALGAEDERLMRFGKKQCLDRFCYVEHSRYTRSVKNYIDTFGKENVLVFIFEEDIVGCPPRGLLMSFSFLGLRSTESIDICQQNHVQYKNASSKPKELLNVRVELASGECVALEDAASGELVEGNVTQIVIRGATTKVEILNAPNPIQEGIDAASTLAARHQTTLTAGEREKLYNEYFAEDIADLEFLLARDLSIWHP